MGACFSQPDGPAPQHAWNGADGGSAAIHAACSEARVASRCGSVSYPERQTSAPLCSQPSKDSLSRMGSIVSRVSLLRGSRARRSWGGGVVT